MLNIEHYRKIIPAQTLLGSVRAALLPDKLKNLFSRHFHTHGMPTESPEEELLRVCFFCLLLKSAELQYKILFPSFAKSSFITLYVLYFIQKLTHGENQAIKSAKLAATFHLCCVAKQDNLFLLRMYQEQTSLAKVFFVSFNFTLKLDHAHFLPNCSSYSLPYLFGLYLNVCSWCGIII